MPRKPQTSCSSVPRTSGGFPKSIAQFIHGGGWVIRQATGKPKARFFSFLSVIWSTVSLCASFPFWHGLPVSLSRLEYLCAFFIALEPVFVALAVFFWLTEVPRPITKALPNPDYDSRNLY